jgi:hypothetical protein
MSFAASMPMASVPDGSVVLLPLAIPVEDALLDFTYVAASKHLFRIHIRPQPQFTYGQCMAHSDGTLDRLVLVRTVKPKGSSSYVLDLEGVKRPTRKKTDIPQREKDSNFVFLAMDTGK